MAAARAVPLYVGEYKLGDCVGRGSEASVWRATHLPTSKTVVAKVIDARKEASRDRALNEASILATLATSARAEGRTVRFHGLHEVPREWIVIFLEYCPLGDLASYVRRYGRLEEDMARAMFLQILEAIEACHQAHVVHHDLKLENILISAIYPTRLPGSSFTPAMSSSPCVSEAPGGAGITAGVPSLRLIDFGLAVTTGSGGEPIEGHFAGSPLYMAPELFSLLPHTEAIDIWSLGVCLFVMVMDTFPFIAESYAELEERVLFDSVRIPLSMGLSDNLTDLLLRLLHKDPAQRITLAQIKEHSWMFGSRWAPLSFS